MSSRHRPNKGKSQKPKELSIHMLTGDADDKGTCRGAGDSAWLLIWKNSSMDIPGHPGKKDKPYMHLTCILKKRKREKAAIVLISFTVPGTAPKACCSLMQMIYGHSLTQYIPGSGKHGSSATHNRRTIPPPQAFPGYGTCYLSRPVKRILEAQPCLVKSIGCTGNQGLPLLLTGSQGVTAWYYGWLFPRYLHTLFYSFCMFPANLTIEMFKLVPKTQLSTSGHSSL